MEHLVDRRRPVCIVVSDRGTTGLSSRESSDCTWSLAPLYRGRFCSTLGAHAALLPSTTPPPGFVMLRGFLTAAVLFAVVPSVGAADPDYSRDIKPLLRTKCYACH